MSIEDAMRWATGGVLGGGSGRREIDGVQGTFAMRRTLLALLADVPTVRGFNAVELYQIADVSGPQAIKCLDLLEDAEWVKGEPAPPGRSQEKLLVYRLTARGVTHARRLLGIIED